MFLNQILAIAFGGAIGSVFRFVTAYKLNQLLGVRFPYGILLVNIMGCLSIGFLSVLLIERLALPPVWRAGVLIGFLGGFTTFSSFTLDTFTLYEQGDHLMAILNIFASMILCLLATILGVYLGRNL